jgi:hypothetical protein
MIYDHTSPTPSLENAIAPRSSARGPPSKGANDAAELREATGLSKQSLVERLFRDKRMALIEDGTTDVLSLVGAHQILIRESA